MKFSIDNSSANERTDSKMSMRYSKIYEDSQDPIRASKSSAGYDLFAYTNTTVAIMPHETVKIGTGVKFEIIDGFFGALFARSGLSTKFGLRPANCVGVIDSDYRGEIIVALHNDSDTYVEIKHGQRIAQIVFIPYIAPNLVEVDELTDTDRSKNGFGSTGEW